MTDEEILDFSDPQEEPKRTNFKFRLDQDLFEVYGELPAGILIDNTDVSFLMEVEHLEGDPTAWSAADQNKMADANRKLFLRYARFVDSVMTPESRERFAERMRDPVNPITLRKLQRTYTGILKKYGEGRPTQPSSPSSNGHGGTEQNSTAEVSMADLTRSASPPTDS